MAERNMDFPSNSNVSREVSSKPPVTPIVDSSAVSSASNHLGRKVLRALISPDATNIPEFIFNTIMTTTKQAFVDTVTMLFIGGNRVSGYTPPTYTSSGGYTPYNSRYKYNNPQNAYSQNRGNPSWYGNPPFEPTNRVPLQNGTGLIDYRDIVVTDPNNDIREARRKAEEVIDQIKEELVQYHKYRLYDFYALCNQTPDPTMQYWGWRFDPSNPNAPDTIQPNDIYLRAVPGGWHIIVPNVVPIEKD